MAESATASPVRIFVHGLESGNQGTKSVYFRERFPDMIIPEFRGGLDERMEKLRTVLAGSSDIRMVGSSFGGLMAALFVLEAPERVGKLVLLAPALNLGAPAAWDGRACGRPVWIYHGRGDKVIDISAVRRIAERLFTDLTFTEADDDHFLHRTFRNIPWESHLT